MVALYQESITDAEARIVDNTDNLEKTESEIKMQETLLAEANADKEVADKDMEDETTRWDHETEVYLDLMAEFDAESKALDAVIDLFVNTNMSGGMMDRLNQ